MSCPLASTAAGLPPPAVSSGSIFGPLENPRLTGARIIRAVRKVVHILAVARRKTKLPANSNASLGDSTSKCFAFDQSNLHLIRSPTLEQHRCATVSISVPLMKMALGARTSRPHSVRSTLAFSSFLHNNFSRFTLNADETSALAA